MSLKNPKHRSPDPNTPQCIQLGTGHCGEPLTTYWGTHRFNASVWLQFWLTPNHTISETRNKRPVCPHSVTELIARHKCGLSRLTNPMFKRIGDGDEAAKHNTHSQWISVILSNGRIRDPRLFRVGHTNLHYYEKGANEGSTRGNIERLP